MSKFIGVKLVDAVVMTAGQAREKGYRVNQNCIDDAAGYEVTYEDGYKSWSPADVFEKYYYMITDDNASKINKQDVENFIENVDVTTIGKKTTVVNAHLLSGFDTVRHSSCVSPENYSEELGKQYAMEEVINDTWAHLGFVLQWAKYGLIGNNDRPPVEEEGDVTGSTIPPHIQRMMKERDELKDRLLKLDKFIGANPIFVTLSEEERRDMKNQLTSMIVYLDCLEKRIARAGIK